MTGWTLGKVKASFFDLEAHCENENCRHFHLFNLDTLIESAGADFADENIPPLTARSTFSLLSQERTVALALRRAADVASFNR